MATDYCNASQIKALMPDTTWGTSYDALLGVLITGASRAIDELYKRKPGACAVSSTAARYYGPQQVHGSFLRIDELAAAPTSVNIALTGDVDNASGSGGTYTALTTNDYFLDPDNAAEDGLPYTGLCLDTQNGDYASWYGYPRGIKVIGKWGYATTSPAIIAQQTKIQTVRWFKRAQQAYKDVRAITELGQLQYVQQLDPDIAVLLMNSRMGRMTI